MLKTLKFYSVSSAYNLNNTYFKFMFRGCPFEDDSYIYTIFSWVKQLGFEAGLSKPLWYFNDSNLWCTTASLHHCVTVSLRHCITASWRPSVKAMLCHWKSMYNYSRDLPFWYAFWQTRFHQVLNASKSDAIVLQGIEFRSLSVAVAWIRRNSPSATRSSRARPSMWLVRDWRQETEAG